MEIFTFKGLKALYGSRLLSCGEEYDRLLSRFPKAGVVYGSKDRVVGEAYRVNGHMVVRTDYSGVGERLDPGWVDASLSPDEQWASVFSHLHVAVGGCGLRS